MLRIKIPTVAPGTPLFDHVVEIYSDKIVVKNPGGSTTTLGTIDELNTWLSNNKGKRIAIYAYANVTSDINLYSGEYWFMKGFFNRYINLYESNTIIVNVGAVLRLVQNVADVSNVTVVSGSLTLLYLINSARGTGVHVAGLFQDLYLSNYEAMVFAEVHRWAYIDNCRLFNLSIKSRYLEIYDSIIEYTPNEVVISTEMNLEFSNVTNNSAGTTNLNIRCERLVSVGAGATVTIPIPFFGVTGYSVVVEYFDTGGATGVTYTIDKTNHVIRITNSGTATATVYIVFRVIY